MRAREPQEIQIGLGLADRSSGSGRACPGRVAPSRTTRGRPAARTCRCSRRSRRSSGTARRWPDRASRQSGRCASSRRDRSRLTLANIAVARFGPRRHDAERDQRAARAASVPSMTSKMPDVVDDVIRGQQRHDRVRIIACQEERGDRRGRCGVPAFRLEHDRLAEPCRARGVARRSGSDARRYRRRAAARSSPATAACLLQHAALGNERQQLVSSVARARRGQSRVPAPPDRMTG